MLILINYINAHPNAPVLPAAPAQPPAYFYDVDNDNACTPADVLLVINDINNRMAGSLAGGEAPLSLVWPVADSGWASPQPRLVSPECSKRGVLLEHSEATLPRTGDDRRMFRASVPAGGAPNCTRHLTETARLARSAHIWNQLVANGLEAVLTELEPVLTDIAGDIAAESGCFTR